MTTPAAPDPSVRMSAPGAAGRRGRTRTRTRSGRFLELDFQAKALELLDEHVEGLRRAGLGRILALDDRFVDPRPAAYVVALHREEFLQRVGRPVGFERPHFHFPEALAAELRLAAQRLLGDERVRTG